MAYLPNVKKRHSYIFPYLRASRTLYNRPGWWLNKWVNVGKRHWMGGREMLHRRLGRFSVKWGTFSILSGPSIPIAASSYSHHLWRIQGHFINEKRQSYSPGISLEENSEHSFLVYAPLLGKGGVLRSLSWGRRKEEWKIGHALQFPNSLQSPYTNWVWPPQTS